IVANGVPAPQVGVEHDTNAGLVLYADGGAREVPLADKREVAGVVLDAALAVHKTNRTGNGDAR
ncbi:bifunctional 4'-phosphopantothenoylcysteine decarboxylase/phosphopantothenoylcysteine synthetase, partial [bacterium]|nr:bifunctional 4'-phosphopantothenoylcysteine decarboxylase/phosphopantothenoylcysteine synthetase [bacterium]